MRRSGAVAERDHRLVAAADYAPVEPATLDQPWPSDWPAAVESGNHPEGDPSR